MQETLHDHHTWTSIGSSPICNLSFTYMEVSTEDNKIMTNSMNNISAEISMNGHKLEEMTNFQVSGRTPVQGWHLLSKNQHQGCLSNGSNGQI